MVSVHDRSATLSVWKKTKTKHKTESKIQNPKLIATMLKKHRRTLKTNSLAGEYAQPTLYEQAACHRANGNKNKIECKTAERRWVRRSHVREMQTIENINESGGEVDENDRENRRRSKEVRRKCRK
jgi:hypothetical protein